MFFGLEGVRANVVSRHDNKIHGERKMSVMIVVDQCADVDHCFSSLFVAEIELNINKDLTFGAGDSAVVDRGEILMSVSLSGSQINIASRSLLTQLFSIILLLLDEEETEGFEAPEMESSHVDREV